MFFNDLIKEFYKSHTELYNIFMGVYDELYYRNPLKKSTMSKEKSNKEKTGKKSPIKNLKEKRAAKNEKREERNRTSDI